MQEIHDRGYRKLFSNKEIFRQLVASFVKEVNMLITAIKEEKKQIREAGRVEGKMLQALDFARLMLKQGEPLAKIKRYTGLSQKTLVKLQEEMQTGSSTTRRFK